MPTPQCQADASSYHPSTLAHEGNGCCRYDAASLASPAPLSDVMTPPSTQMSRPALASTPKRSDDEKSLMPASPPTTIQTHVTHVSSAGVDDLPTPEIIAGATETELRTIAGKLVAAVCEARISAAHYKFQYSMLSMESKQSTQRMKVEHEMEMREAEVLREINYQRRSALAFPDGSTVPKIDILVRHCKALESANTTLERRLRRAKKLILFQEDKNELLSDDVNLLRQRIRDNRDHINRMRTSGLFSTRMPVNRDDFAAQSVQHPRLAANVHSGLGNTRASSQDPLAALLAADQVLKETNSVPSTPDGNYLGRHYSTSVRSNHARGSQSLSSLPATPQTQPAVSVNPTFTPVNRISSIDNRFSYSAPGSQVISQQRELAREDRDSTISLSDHDDEAITDEDPRDYQASRVASNTLRHGLDHRHDNFTAPMGNERLGNMTQGTIFGQVRKPGLESHSKAEKRGRDYEIDRTAPMKRVKVQEGIGLGISHR